MNKFFKALFALISKRGSKLGTKVTSNITIAGLDNLANSKNLAKLLPKQNRLLNLVKTEKNVIKDVVVNLKKVDPVYGRLVEKQVKGFDINKINKLKNVSTDRQIELISNQLQKSYQKLLIGPVGSPITRKQLLGFSPLEKYGGISISSLDPSSKTFLFTTKEQLGLKTYKDFNQVRKNLVKRYLASDIKNINTRNTKVYRILGLTNDEVVKTLNIINQRKVDVAKAVEVVTKTAPTAIPNLEATRSLSKVEKANIRLLNKKVRKVSPKTTKLINELYDIQAKRQGLFYDRYARNLLTRDAVADDIYEFQKMFEGKEVIRERAIYKKITNQTITQKELIKEINHAKYLQSRALKDYGTANHKRKVLKQLLRFNYKEALKKGRFQLDKDSVKRGRKILVEYNDEVVEIAFNEKRFVDEQLKYLDKQYGDDIDNQLAHVRNRFDEYNEYDKTDPLYEIGTDNYETY